MNSVRFTKKPFSSFLLFCFFITSMLVIAAVEGEKEATDQKSIYQFTAKNIDNEDISLAKYKGKVVLIVNVASECGFTDSNYRQMRVLLEKYADQGFAIAAFPCNQFGSQEPKSGPEIRAFVREQFHFEPDMYAKVDVNGAEEHPLFAFLKREQSGTLTDAIKWNFTKFLVDRRGHPVARYSPTKAPEELQPEIERLLAEHPESDEGTDQVVPQQEL